MAIIATPSILSFTSIESFRLERYSAVIRSRFTGQSQRILYPFAVWVLEGKLKDYVEPEATGMRGFFANLQGQTNSFRWTIPGKSVPSTNFISGSIVSNGAYAARVSAINAQGAPASSNVLLVGDYFTINDELKVCTTNFLTNGLGQGVINFTPPLRKPIGNGTTITINNPTCLMYAADDDVLNQAIRPPVITGFSLKAVEAIDI